MPKQGFKTFRKRGGIPGRGRGANASRPHGNASQQRETSRPEGDSRPRGNASRGRGSASRGQGLASRSRGISSRARGISSRGRGVISTRGRGVAARSRGNAPRSPGNASHSHGAPHPQGKHLHHNNPASDHQEENSWETDSLLDKMLQDLSPEVRREFQQYPPVVQLLARIAIGGSPVDNNEAFHLLGSHGLQGDPMSMVDKFRPLITKLVQSAAAQDCPGSSMVEDLPKTDPGQPPPGPSRIGFGDGSFPMENRNLGALQDSQNHQNYNFPSDNSAIGMVNYMGAYTQQLSFAGAGNAGVPDRTTAAFMSNVAFAGTPNTPDVSGGFVSNVQPNTTLASGLNISFTVPPPILLPNSTYPTNVSNFYPNSGIETSNFVPPAVEPEQTFKPPEPEVESYDPTSPTSSQHHGSDMSEQDMLPSSPLNRKETQFDVGDRMQTEDRNPTKEVSDDDKLYREFFNFMSTKGRAGVADPPDDFSRDQRSATRSPDQNQRLPRYDSSSPEYDRSRESPDPSQRSLDHSRRSLDRDSILFGQNQRSPDWNLRLANQSLRSQDHSQQKFEHNQRLPDHGRRTAENSRKSPDNRSFNHSSSTRTSDNSRRSPDQKLADRGRKLPENSRGLPDVRRRSPESGCRSPSQKSRSSENRIRKSPGRSRSPLDSSRNRRSQDRNRRSQDRYQTSQDRYRTSQDQNRRSQDRNRRLPDHSRGPPDRNRKSPDPGRRLVDQSMKSSDRSRKSPDRSSRLVDRSQRSSDRTRPTVDLRRRSPDPSLRSGDQARKSPGPHRRSVDRNRRSPDPSSRFVDLRSQTIDRRSPDRNRLSAEKSVEPSLHPSSISRICVTNAISGRRLSRTEGEMVELALLKRITAKDDIKCHGVYRQAGAVVFVCDDEKSARWIVRTVPFLLPWAGAALKAEPWAERSSLPELLFELPSILTHMPWAGLCEKIHQQNAQLATSEWKLIVDEETTRVCTVDKKSLNVLRKQNFKAFVGFSQIEFKIISVGK
ncbi:Hypothetical protein NTJ_12102 [Nesidiocoris tenuis]|uniref:DUF4780 domain-containing protein n=1 Tax=Nesidiocoris tenuis TaxID=355587 RepID=A0ABN7B6M7_9HEMI|nr:Hypothetical protein NTJ_12102 [Nesidiocoris tenuis]